MPWSRHATSVDDDLTTGNIVVAPGPDEPGGPLRVRSGPNTPRRTWTRAGLNHEYLVQLAHLSRLADALGPAGSSRVRVETADWLLAGHAKPVGDAASGEWCHAVRVIDGVAQCGPGGVGWETSGRARLAAALAG